MKAKNVFLFILIPFFAATQNPLQPGQVTGSEFEYAAQALQSVNFDATSPFDTYFISKDDGNLWQVPQWDVSQTNNPAPVGYAGGATPEITAVFSNCPAKIWIKGAVAVGTETLSFPPLELTSSGGTVTYGPQVAMTGAPAMPFTFPSQMVQYIEKFEIVWKMCNTNSSNENDWTEIATSSNPVYVTYDNPDSSFPFHTVLHLGCSNANGLSGPPSMAGPAIVDAMFAPFLASTFDIRRTSDDKKLTYYADPDGGSSCPDLASLLKSIDGDARCGGMAELFNTMVKDQGITGSNGVAITHQGTTVGGQAVVSLTPASITDMNADAVAQFGVNDIQLEPESHFYHFMVKNWSGYSEGNFLELDGTTYDEAKSSIGDMGIPGQGDVTDPRSIFVNHIYITYDNKIYDPSYGIIQSNTSLATYEDNSLEVVSGTIVYRIANNMKKYYFWVETNNTTTIQDLQSITVY